MRRPLQVVLALAAAAGGFAGIAAAGGETRQDVATMDVELLRENLIKLWIIEYRSQTHNQRRIAEISFEGLNVVPSTGDAELDRQNEAARVKTSKNLRHYLALELDGSIECVDIASRVLGTKVTLDPAEAAKRRFFQQELPAIRWSNVLLQDVVRELGTMTGAQTELHPEIPKNLTLEVSFDAPAGFSLQGVLEYVNGIHPIEWKYENGKLDVTYVGEIPKNPFGR